MRIHIRAALLVALATLTAVGLQAQRLRVHVSAIYVSDEVVYAAPDPAQTGSINRIKGGFKPGLTLEYRPKRQAAYELMYFGQNTRIEDWHYPEGTGYRKTDLKANFNHLLVSSIRYLGAMGKTDPFVGLMGGIGITRFQNPVNGISNTRPAFAWGLRSGMDINRVGILGARVFANLLWTMKSIGGNFSSGSAGVQDRYASMVQLQLGTSLSFQPRKPHRTPRVRPVRKAVRVPLDTSSDARFNARRNLVFREIVLSGDTLQLRLFDNGIIDNDTVTLYLNGHKYVTRQMLRAQPEVIVLPIKEMYDTTDFVMLAESQGYIPPNTAMLRANFDGKEQYIQMESTDTTSAMIRFINPGGRARWQMDIALMERERLRDSIVRVERIRKVMEMHASEIRMRIPSAQVAREDTRIRILFSTGLMFEKNSFQISESYKNDLTTLKAIYQRFPDSRITIEGHTDDSGPEVYNNVLSRRRAQAVFDYLQLIGLPGERMETVGHGESQPKYPNDTEENRVRNRRVEIVISPNL
jgi:outer membrane protein OmpA-like peptidoglycan-associated protein